MKSKRASKSSASLPPSNPSRGFGALLALALLSAGAVLYVSAQGWTLYYGDAQAHLNIARRIVDARLPGYEQIGTVWLPLPHLLMLPFTMIDALWRSGIGGAIPAALCFVLGGWFLYQATHRIFGSPPPAAAALAAYALNPNLLYLQSTPMTESMSLCCALGLLYACARFRQSQRTADALLAGVIACCGTLIRYEGWFLLPFVAGFFLLCGGAHRWRSTLAFCLIAALGPLYWLAHNAILYSDPLEFYRGEWSAKMIYQRALDQGGFRYPGDHDWPKAWQYYRAAAELCIGRPLAWLGVAGLAAALFKRAWWAVALLALTPAFYVLSLYSSGTPIFVPTLWPNSYYNTRYGLNFLPLACLGIAALTALLPVRWRTLAAVLLVVATVSPWAGYPRKENWVTWRESEQNSADRRAWTKLAVDYLKPRYKPGAGIFMGFGDQSGILREAGIPLRESFHQGDGPFWQASAARPDLFLRQEWAIALPGDEVSKTLRRMKRGPRRYECVRIFAVHERPAIEIWRHIQ